MLLRLRNILLQASADSSSPEPADLASPDAADMRLACAALMVEAARMDDTVDDAERERITDLVCWRFELDDDAAAALVAEAEAHVTDAVQWHGYAETIRRAFGQEQRRQLMDMLWDIVFADGEEHTLEASLMRRIAGLLYVSDIENGQARKRAIARHGL